MQFGVWKKLCQINYKLYFFADKRLFLSDAYKCQETWERRLQNPVIQNIKLGTSFHTYLYIFQECLFPSVKLEVQTCNSCKNKFVIW